MVDAGGKRVDLGALGLNDDFVPRIHRFLKIRQVLQERVGKLRGGFPIRRHVDAARFHHDRINLAVEMLEVHRALARGVDGALGPVALPHPKGSQAKARDGQKAQKPDDSEELFA